MVAEAERYKEEDERQRECVQAKNALEAYVFQLKQAVDEAGERLGEEDKAKVRAQCEETIRWLDANGLAAKDEFEHRQQELSRECSPIMAKLHQAGAGASSCGQQSGGFGGRTGPTVEEVD